MEHVFLPSLLVVAGICLFAGLNHLIAWSRGAPDAPTHGWFGTIALFVGIYTISAWIGYRATDVDSLVQARRVSIAIALIALPAFVFFTIHYARWRPRRLALLVWTIPAVMFVANLVMPYTLAYMDEPTVRSTLLGDGSVVSTVQATPTYAAVAVWAPVYAFVLMGALRLWRSGDRDRAIPLLVGVSLMVIAAVNDTLVARGLTGAYLSEFAFLGLVGLMSVRLSEELVGGAALERALSRSEQRLRLTLDSIADAVIVVDAHGGVSLMNPAAARITGVPHEEAKGRPLGEVVVLRKPSDGGLLVEDVAFTAPQTAAEPPTLYSHDGVERQVLTSSATILDDNGQRAGAVVVLRDVTRERELERRIRETRTMRAIGETAGSIAHEYKNLLGIVLGHTELLEEIIPAEEPDGHDSLVAIEGAARRALDLSRRALALSPARDTPLETVRMHEVVASALKLIGETLGPKIWIRSSLTASVDAVPGDADELRSALVNLAMNARDAMPFGGELEIATDVVPITGDEIVAQAFDLVPGSFLRIRVTDTGGGISPQVRDRIFEPFFTTKPRGQGTGLGLAAVYSAVTEPGGAVEVSSLPGTGTTFLLYLPLIDAAGHI